MNEARARQALSHVRRLFLDHGLEVWLDSGTLLGAARNGRLIIWDNDIDLGVWKSEFDRIDQQKLWRDANACGLDAYLLADKFVLESRQASINVSLFERDGEIARRPPYPLDTNWLSRQARVLWWVFHARPMRSGVLPPLQVWPSVLAKRVLTRVVGWLPPAARRASARLSHRLCLGFGCVMIQKAVPARFFRRFGELALYGESWPAPLDLEDYLIYRYGENWREPQREWKSTRDDGAILRDSSPPKSRQSAL